MFFPGNPAQLSKGKRMKLLLQLQRRLNKAYKRIKRLVREFCHRLINDPDYANAAASLVVRGVERWRPKRAGGGPAQQLARTLAALLREAIQNRQADDLPWQLA
jgi:hypothetical protein